MPLYVKHYFYNFMKLFIVPLLSYPFFLKKKLCSLSFLFHFPTQQFNIFFNFPKSLHPKSFSKVIFPLFVSPLSLTLIKLTSPRQPLLYCLFQTRATAAPVEPPRCRTYGAAIADVVALMASQGQRRRRCFDFALSFSVVSSS